MPDAPRLSLEEAIAELLAALSADEIPPEAEMQALFERFPVALTSLGFERVLAHPRLEYMATGDAVVPDFMAWAPDETCTIIEIKRPSLRPVVLGPDRRPRESAELTDAIAQGREYVRFFDESANRERFQERYKLPCHKDPSIWVLIGRSGPNDRLARLVVERDRAQSLVVKTYDDLVVDLEVARRRNFGVREGIEGVSLHILLAAPCESDEHRGTVFSAGDVEEGRWRAWIGPGCEVSLDVSPPGLDRWVSIASLPGAEVLPSGHTVLLSFEFGSFPGFATTAIYVDGKPVVETEYFGDSPLPRLESLEGARFGASKFGNPSARMALMSAAVFKRTMTPWERYQLRDELESDSKG